ncbi:MAG TPA: YihY/virulence factor BrkB family protein [Acidisarcina sp.]
MAFPKFGSLTKPYGVPGGQLATRVYKSAMADDAFGRAAQLAYYFFFAMFPGLMFISAILGFLARPGSNLAGSMMDYLGRVLPQSASQLVGATLTQTVHASSAGKLSIGILLALWSATCGMTGAQDGLNSVYKVEEGRPIWKSRAIALALTVLVSLLSMAALTVLFYGSQLAELINAHFFAARALLLAMKVGMWLLALFLLSLVFAVTYYWAPDVKQATWHWITPGAAVGVLGWIAGSIGLKVYLHFFNSYSVMYGSLGAVIILLTWFYLTGLVLLMGAEINAVLEAVAAEQGHPDAKRQGEKVPQAEHAVS